MNAFTNVRGNEDRAVSLTTLLAHLAFPDWHKAAAFVHQGLMAVKKCFQQQWERMSG